MPPEAVQAPTGIVTRGSGTASTVRRTAVSSLHRHRTIDHDSVRVVGGADEVDAKAANVVHGFSRPVSSQSQALQELVSR